MTRKLIIAACLLAIFIVSAKGQDSKKYSNGGVTFEYGSGWEPTEQVSPDSHQISLSNKAADSQILLIVLRKRVETKEPRADLKKQVVDPWLAKLMNGYKDAGISVVREPANTEVGGQPAEGERLKFVFDGQLGGGEAYWALLDRRLVLAYFIRPDKTAEKASAGWNMLRKSLKVEAEKK